MLRVILFLYAINAIKQLIWDNTLTINETIAVAEDIQNQVLKRMLMYSINTSMEKSDAEKHNNYLDILIEQQ